MAHPEKHPLKGFKAVVEALRLESFPMDRQGIDYCVGDIEVEDGHGGYVPVRQLTDRLPDESQDQEFRSAEEVVKALRSVVLPSGKTRAA